ncbi:MAG: hypothetical protein N4A76_15170 [Firmicutes bacterium]|jgi:hypothetical protein|nr:hypothetical protein [Bacillota bacterium]
MNLVDKIIELASDEKNEFQYVVGDYNDFNIANEKLHSMAQWLNLFLKEYKDYDIEKMKLLEIDNKTIEFIKYISVCNGIIDICDGISLISVKYFNSSPEQNQYKYFMKTREINKNHDELFSFIKKTDKEYFKHIRAAFGQHPTNLNYPKQVRGFASWTFHNNKVHDYGSDLYVNIYYDSQKNSWGEKFHLYFCEIKNYVDYQIDMIERIIDYINESILRKRHNMCKPIEGWKQQEKVYDKLILLKKEAKTRYVTNQSHYIVDAIDTLKTMIKDVESSNFISYYSEYIIEISKVVDELYLMVSKCEQNDLVVYRKFMLRLMSAIGKHYYVEKVSMYLIGYEQEYMIFENVVNRICDKLEVKECSSLSKFYFYLFVLHEKKIILYDEVF